MSRARGLVLVLALLAAAPGARAETEDVVLRVASIAWSGVDRIPRETLEARMLTRTRGWKCWRKRPVFDAQLLEEDLERLRAAYRAEGYYEAEVSAEVEREDDRWVRIRIQVVEGEPARIERWRVGFVDGRISEEERGALLDGLPLAEGAVFRVREYRAAKEELLRRLAERGRPAARISGGAEVVLAIRAVRVEWQVDPGPEVHFGPVRVSGLERVDEALVRRELVFRSGDRFGLHPLQESRELVYGLGLFRSVIVQPQHPEHAATPPPEGVPPTEAWPVDVRVEELPPRRLRAGIGFGTEDSLRLQASWLRRNFLGGARELEVSGKYSSLLAGLDVRFFQPRLRDGPFSLEVKASGLREMATAFDADSARFGFTFERPWVAGWRGSLGYGFEQTRVTRIRVDDPTLEDVPDSYRLAFAELGLRRVTVDDRLEPRRGSWLELGVKPAASALGSEIAFVQWNVEARAFLPWRALVLALRVRGTTLDPMGATGEDEIPISLRLFSGGSTSVRGFEYQKLGPLDEDEEPLGGLSLAEASAELRFPIYGRLGGVVFVDTGQVAEQPYTFRGGDFFHSAGAGVRIRTPVGPLRVDLGYLLNPPDGLTRLRVHLSIGHAF